LFKIIFSLRSPRRFRRTLRGTGVASKRSLFTATPAHRVRSIETHDMDSSGLA
jgi:hypothetical protein